MKIGVRLAKLDSSPEDFSLKLAIVFVPLAASSKVVIRHESQWQIPILLDHARTKHWTSIAGSTAFEALDEYIRTLLRFGDPPLERQVDTFDPVTDNTLTHLIEGRWHDLDQDEHKHSHHADLLALYQSDTEHVFTPPDLCLPVGPAIKPTAASSKPTLPLTTVDPDALARQERTLLQNIDNISRALGAGPGPVALQTKGSAYLGSTRTRHGGLLVVASLVDNPYNLGGLSRCSEIFGAGALYVHNMAVLASRDFTGVSVSSHAHLDIRPLPVGEMAAWLGEKRRGEGYSVVGIEQTDRSVLVGDEGCVLPEKCILVLGSEAKGIPALLLSECDVLVEIPQVGVTRSLNVQTAAAIVLCEYAKQRRVAAQAGAVTGRV